ncbi:MAG: DEAD/DEAH box helicase [Deltaproteobacteria bacterium]|nr:DEAD/DEAH box helicase [Deltaproteobacteria bacterium]
MTEKRETPVSTVRSEKPDFLTPVWFEEFGLPGEVLAGIRDAGFTASTPLQSQAIPLALQGRDVMAPAASGTGKVAAFLVPLFSRLLRLEQREEGHTSGLALVPSAELAAGIHQDALVLGRHTGLTCALVSDGPCREEGLDPLRDAPDLVIATPNRLAELVREGTFKTGAIRVFILDEADRFFELGLLRDMRYILRKLPFHDRRVSMVFSPTLSHRLLTFICHYVNLPEFVSGVTEADQIQGVDQSLFHVGSHEKTSLLMGLLKREDCRRVIVFVDSREGVEALVRTLKGNGFSAEGIFGEVPLRKRLRLMAWLQRGHTRILVATDSASTAVHMEGVTQVINFDLPQDAATYIRRLGRATGGEKPGRAISLACEGTVFHLESIEEGLGSKIPVLPAETDWFAKDLPSPEPEEPEPFRELPAKEEEAHEEKRALRARGGNKIAFSTQPGGVFGLAPTRTAPGDRGPSSKKKPRKRRPRRAGNAEANRNAHPSEPTEKISTE